MTSTPLAEELLAVRAELTRTDTKCSTLAGLAGAAAAFIATQINNHTPLPVRSLLGLAGVLLVAATVALLLGVLRPRLGSTGFRRYARMSPSQIGSLFHQDHEHSQHDQAEDLQVLSRICDVKNRRLRHAVDLIASGLALIGLAVVAGAIW